jgi:hypothetical protein
LLEAFLNVFKPSKATISKAIVILLQLEHMWLIAGLGGCNVALESSLIDFVLLGELHVHSCLCVSLEDMPE